MTQNKEKREFAQQLEQTAPFATEAMKLATLKKLSRLLENE